MAPKKRLLPGNPLWSKSLITIHNTDQTDHIPYAVEWLQEWESEVDSTRSEYFAKAGAVRQIETSLTVSYYRQSKRRASRSWPVQFR